jgi:diaminopimelate epimerase
MNLNFTKMHGLGNDFVLIEWPEGRPRPPPALVQSWSDRRLGIGFDSLLLIDRSSGTACYQVLNADGGEAEQCGNGVRCIASFLAPAGETELKLQSRAGPIIARVGRHGLVSINLGEPDFRPESLPFLNAGDELTQRRVLSDGPVEFAVVSMGNPHAVIAVSSVESAPVARLGAELGRHADFPRGVNVGFAARQSEARLNLRVCERGIGETRACGTGAAAAVAVGIRAGRLAPTVEVNLPGGVLTVSWQGSGTPLWQTGPTAKVYEGRIEQ